MLTCYMYNGNCSDNNMRLASIYTHELKFVISKTFENGFMEHYSLLFSSMFEKNIILEFIYLSRFYILCTVVNGDYTLFCLNSYPKVII